MFNKKCRFWKNCKLYNKKSDVCNKYSGNYYGVDSFDFRGGGCYRSLDSEGKYSKHWKD